MRRRAGDVLFVLGAAVLAAAFIRGAQTAADDAAAGQASAEILSQFYVDTAVNGERTSAPDAPPRAESGAPAEGTAEEAAPVCFGALSIPAIELELPVLQTSTDGNLELAPCRQFGAADTGDLVIAGHNYRSQFYRLRDLRIGDAVTFLDWSGAEHAYAVAKCETIAPDDVAAVQSAAYPLVLYTCTPGAKARVAVFCNYA